jgi:hypothetical protein
MGGKSSSKNGAGAGSGGASETPAGSVEAGAGTAGSSADSQAGYAAGGNPSSAGASAAPGLESVGMVGGADRLIAEAEAAAAGAPAIDPATGQAATAEPVNVSGQWATLTPPTVEVLCGVVLPAWQIGPVEQRCIAEPLAECLEQVFPGGIQGQYACWVRLITACGAIAVSRVQANGGKLPRIGPNFRPESAKPNGAAGPPRDPMTLTSLTE